MALWAAGLLIVLLVYLFLHGGGQRENAQLAPPADFQLLAEIDLAARPYGLDTVAQFTLQETADVGIFYAMPNFNTAYLDLSLIGPNGERYVILHSEDLKTDAAGGGSMGAALKPGRLPAAAHHGTEPRRVLCLLGAPLRCRMPPIMIPGAVSEKRK